MGLREMLVLTPHERADETIDEETFARNTATGTDTGVLSTMQCVEQSAVDQVGRPNYVNQCQNEVSAKFSIK